MTSEQPDSAADTLNSGIHLHRTMFSLREPIIGAAIKALNLPVGSSGLDAGCGVGLITQLLSKAISPDGHVVGLDLSSQYLGYARSSIRDSASPGQISFHEGNVNELPFDDGCFDWVWSMDTIWPGPKEIGCPSEDPLSMVQELARVVKPGGIVAILFWSSQKILPGYPLLESRLSTTSGATAPFRQGMTPQQHVLRGLGWLGEIGLVGITAHTFVADVVAPLDEEIRHALTVTFPMFWEGVEGEVSQEDWAEYKRLCDPESPEFLPDRPDYYAFLTYTMFRGTIAG